MWDHGAACGVPLRGRGEGGDERGDGGLRVDGGWIKERNEDVKRINQKDALWMRCGMLRA